MSLIIENKIKFNISYHHKFIKDILHETIYESSRIKEYEITLLYPTCEQTYTRILNFTLCTYYLVERENRDLHEMWFSRHNLPAERIKHINTKASSKLTKFFPYLTICTSIMKTRLLREITPSHKCNFTLKTFIIPSLQKAYDETYLLMKIKFNELCFNFLKRE